MHWEPSLAEGDDFWVIGKLEQGEQTPARLVLASTTIRIPTSRTARRPRWSITRTPSHGVPVPMIGHETGQFQVSPDFREIGKFTGVLEARNYQIFRDRLEEGRHARPGA